MMTCERCRCETHVIYVTQGNGKICDKCRVELVTCRCADSDETSDKGGRSVG
jgi:hypothetical protein